MAALIVGTVLALGALAFVLYPIFADGSARLEDVGPRVEPSVELGRAIEALREIEFEGTTGKLSQTDYAALKAAYTADAVEAMRSAGVASIPDDPVEAMIVRYRAVGLDCPQCGERSEPAAVFCSSCGRKLE